MLQQLLQIKKIKRSFSIIPAIFCLLFVLSSKGVWAYTAEESTNDFYQVAISVPSSHQNDKEIYFQNGLKTVLKRITGTETILENQNVLSALESPMSYVQQFSYQGNQYLIKFSPKLVDEIAFQNGFSVWGQTRPTLILWLGVSENNQRRIVGTESDPELYQALEQAADSRGLQLVLPLMDLMDIDQVTVSDLWGQFPSVVATASERYGANAILIGKVTKKETDWEGTWELLIDDIQRLHTSTATDFDNMLMQGLYFSVAQLQARFGINRAVSQSETLLVDVRGIYSASDLNRAELYLNGLDQLKEVAIKEIIANRVVFEVKPQGSVDKNILSQVISMDRHLIKVPVFEQNKNESTLSYRWAS